MKYFIDTEFIEGFHKPLFGKKRHFIDLISIGIVAEDGRKFYAISNEYNYKDADEWVKENVIKPMYIDTVHGDMRNKCDVSNFHTIFGQSNKSIVQDLLAFFGKEPEIYGYYADYDWVLLCSLFGRMIDLPKGFPMYCIDLKQIIDEKAETIATAGRYATNKKDALAYIKRMPSYPEQVGEHNALSDAIWTRNLHHFLSTNAANNNSS